MGLLDRMFGRALPASTSHEKVREQPGPLTAHEAWELARPAALGLDPSARLLLIQSGTDIRTNGRSLTWELLFQLPTKKARVLLTLSPFAAANDPERAPIILHRRVTREERPASVEALPENFRDSPEAVTEMIAQGVDFVAGPSDLKLESCARGSGMTVWLMRCWDDEFETDFGAKPGR